MKVKHAIAISLAVVLAGWGSAFAAPAASDGNNGAAVSGGAAYTGKGADTCLRCHDEDSRYPVYPIFKTPHAQPADVRTPFAGKQCEACHGPGGEHAQWVQAGGKQGPIDTFGPRSKRSATEQNRACLGCHSGGGRMAWQGSTHQSRDVACTSCHRIHAAQDPALTARDQPEICYPCHKKARAEFLKTSRHPVGFGKMSCADCHQVHGSAAPAMLRQLAVNDTCYTCHAEKRGPLLWEHAPVTEDCRICHNPHGSVQPALLKRRPPLLCQQCHSQLGHTSAVRGSSGLPGNQASTFLLAGSCINCHSQVHGSNHPSGAALMR